MSKKLDIFVAMPFGGKFDLIYRHLIKTPLATEGHKVRRADDEPEYQNILETIIQGISNTDLIIADLTGENANVYYELGIAHTLKKPTIQIVQNVDDILFSLHSYNTIRYSINSDGSSELATRILNMIEQDNHKFSNPFNDFSAGPKEIIKLPRSSGIDDNVDDDEEVATDDSDYSRLDASADVEEAMNEIASITKEISLDISKITEKTKARNAEANKLKSKPNQQRLQSKLLRVLQQFASDLNEFSDNVNQKTPDLKEAWIKLDQGLGHVLLISNIENQPDLEATLSLLDQMNDLRDKQGTAIKSTEGFRDSQKNLTGLSRVSNRAVRNSVKTIDKLLGEFKLGDSVLTRLIDLTTDMIDRYNANMPDNGDDDSA